MIPLQLTPEQHLMSPLEKCYNLNLIETPVQMESKIKVSYILIGSFITIMIIYGYVVLQDQYQQKKDRLIGISENR